MDSPCNAAIDQFIAMETEFLQALSEVFPECGKLQSCKLQFSLACQLPSQRKERIEEWIQYMGPLFEACKDRNVDRVIRNANFPPTVQQIDIEAKWWDADIDEETREVCWTYLLELNKIAMMYQLYASVPQNMMTKITSLATELADGMSSGQPLDLQKVQDRVKGAVTDDELQQFAQGVDFANVQNLQKSLMGNIFGKE